jgi:hypothetical protein
VRLTAEVKRMEGDTAVVIASDGGEIQIQLHRVRTIVDVYRYIVKVRSSIFQEANLASKYCEIIGRVNEDLSVKVLWSTNMGDDLGKESYSYVAYQNTDHRAIPQICPSSTRSSNWPMVRRVRAFWRRGFLAAFWS